MGHKKSHREAVEERELRGDVAPANHTRNSSARPRLGAADDPWSTVLKDVAREAPKTAVVVAGSVLLVCLSLVAHLIGVLAGYGNDAPPLDPSVQHAVQVAVETFRRVITKGS